MGLNNAIAIVTDSQFVAQEIKNMLVLLRDVDKVECYDYFDAEDKIKENIPNVIVLHALEKDKNSLKMIKKIRNNEPTAKTPIILYSDSESADFIVEAFDLGVTDLISAPLKDYELIIRVIWAIQKSEQLFAANIQNRFLAKLDIADEKTGFCKEEYSIKYLETIVGATKENKQNACLMLIKAYPAISIEEDRDAFTKTLKNSIRLNDFVAIKDDDTFYVFLSKAKLNGMYSIYERFLSKIGPMVAINASAVEIKDELFENVINVLNYTINKAPKNGEISIVKDQDYIDMYKEEELSIPEVLSSIEKISQETEDEALSEDDTINLGLKIMQEKVNEIDFNKENAIRRAKAETKNEEEETDKRNAVVYKQTWGKKLNVIFEPLLKKYAASFQEKHPTLDANIYTTLYESFLKLEYNDVKYTLEVKYDGLKTLNFHISIYALTAQLEEDSFDIEIMDLDSQKLDIILKTSTEEYEKYARAD